MHFVRQSTVALAVLASLFFGTGCEPGANVESPEQQSRKHFQRARELMDRDDFEGGLVQMKRALQHDPDYAPIHHDLGEYYFDTGTNYPEALYHFRRVLDIQPDHVLRGTIEQRMQYCKMEIGEGSIPLDGSSSLVNQVKKLNQELTAERARRMELETQYARLSEQLTGSSPATPPPNSGENPRPEQPSLSRSSSRPGSDSSPPSQRVRQAAVSQPNESQPAAVGTMRVHVIRQGETLYRLSRQYGVAVDDIKAANPGLIPTDIQVGARINIPPN